MDSLASMRLTGQELLILAIRHCFVGDIADTGALSLAVLCLFGFGWEIFIFGGT